MYKLRIKYQKTGNLKFLSHLDLVRAFERGLRRTELPLSFSEGFNPHPKISFGPPLPVGVSSDSEYIDLLLNKRIPLADVASSLHGAFPSDLYCKEVRYIPLDSPSLMSLIKLASYRIVLSVNPALTSDEIRRYMDLILSEKEVTFLVRGKEKTFQVSQIVSSLNLTCVEDDTIAFEFLGLVSSADGVRPDILIRKILSLADRHLAIEFQETDRTGQYWEENGKLVAP